MKKIFFAFLFSLIVAISFQRCCDALAAADLLIPLVTTILDQYGNSVLDINGNPFEDYNEVYYNHRTSEIFSKAFPNKNPNLVGDILDIGTRVFDTWYDQKCLTGAEAGPSYTMAKLNYSGPLGSGSVPLQPFYTPGIQLNNPFGSWAVSPFQVNALGTYKVNFDANFDKAIVEHDYDNNLYNDGSGGITVGKTVENGLLVEEGTSTEPWVTKELPTKIVAKCNFYKQFDWGTSESTYEKSPFVRFLKVPGNLAKFYQFKLANPEKPFIIPE